MEKVVFWSLFRIHTLEVIYMLYLGKDLRAWQREFKVFKSVKLFRISGFSYWVIEPIRKNGNDEKLQFWLNFELFYESFFFETINYVFCWKNLLWCSLILLSGVSGISVELTWPVKLNFIAMSNSIEFY